MEPFNSTMFNAVIIFHCEEGLIPDTVIEAVCGSTGVWSPNPANHFCVNQSLRKQYANHLWMIANYIILLLQLSVIVFLQFQLMPTSLTSLLVFTQRGLTSLCNVIILYPTPH